MGDKKIDLSKYDNSDYNPGANKFKLLLWYFINAIFFKSPLIPFNKLKTFLLKFFGAKLGKNITIKPAVNIKYPWNLKIGDNVWIGENVWIDNLDEIVIGNNVCISQAAMLLSGNHNYKSQTFDLITGKITIEDGVWICAYSIVCADIICKSHSILLSNSVANKDLEEYSIYRGNPAIFTKKRIIN